LFNRKYLHLIICFFIWEGTLIAQKWSLDQFISDTLIIQLADSGKSTPVQLDYVLDHRNQTDNFLGIRQIKQYMFIPVDQYILADCPLAECMEDSITLPSGHNLVIDYLDIWHKGSWRLNGYTYETNSAGKKIRDWQWSVKIKKKWREPAKKTISRLTKSWISDQNKALNNNTEIQLSPRPYGRQLLVRADIVISPDGYTIIGRFAAPYPIDQKKNYTVSIPGMYYRKARYHESIAISGRDYQYFTRFSESWLFRINNTFFLGVNNFDGKHFDYIPPKNILLINVGLAASVEYRPPYLKGFFWGAGVYGDYNLLPEIVARDAWGLLISTGVMLP